MKRLIALLTVIAGIAIAVPSIAQADPLVGDGCTTVNNDRGVVVTSSASYDGYGCDTGTYVEITTWWSDTRDEMGCNAYGNEPHGFCTG